MSNVLTFLGLFSVGGFAFGRIWRRFFRRRRIGIGRVLLARFFILAFLVIFGGLYVGLLNSDGPELALTGSERTLATWGLPIAFVLSATIAYRIGTRARIVTRKAGQDAPSTRPPRVAHGDVGVQHTSDPAPPVSSHMAVLPPPMSPEPVPPAPQPEGPFLPPRP